MLSAILYTGLLPAKLLRMFEVLKYASIRERDFKTIVVGT